MIACVLSTGMAGAGTDDFIAEYRQFLDQHQNMTTAQLLSMHPAGQFRETAGAEWESAMYHDLVQNAYNLTDYEKSLLDSHGFVVTERLSKGTFAEQFIDIWHKDLPVFISTDAILHAFHYQYDQILKNTEKGLYSDLVQMLTRMHGAIPDLAAKYAGAPGLERMLRDVDIYVTVPLKLLEQNISPNYAANGSEIEEILALIDAEGIATYPFFSDHCKYIDFSQFKPRGHYVVDEGEVPPDETDKFLPHYFRAMMWFGRIEIYLLPPRAADFMCPKQTTADIQRQTIDAVLINELMNLAGVQPLYKEIEDILLFFVGEQDNVTPANLDALVQSIHLTNSSQLLDTLMVKQLQDSLQIKAFAFQRIVSQLLYNDPDSPESIRPASAFMLFGQRFVIDSYVTGSVVYDQIKYNGGFPCRLFPSTLDILYALGNDAAAQLLVPELDEYCYSSNLTSLRYLADAYEPEFWDGSIHNMWLNCIRALNPPPDRQTLPTFMQTGAWWQQKMNTQLASWTELRHDHLLYAKQSYTGIPVCSYPSSYVEPFPEFYRRFKTLAETALDRFTALEISNSRVMDYFNLLYTVCDTLESIAIKELSGIPLDIKEISFMKSMVSEYPDGCVPNYDGWYIQLCYFNMDNYYTNRDIQKKDHIAADYHTTPADCGGNIMGWVSHAGTGACDLAIITAPNANGQVMAFVGPVSSYHEYVTVDFLRLTDEEWADKYLASSSRPDWVNIYLANTEGQSRGPGLNLITGVKDPDPTETQQPSGFIVAQNYPNPFNASTIIRFSITHAMAGLNARLTVYNIQGEAIKKLVERALSAGTYLTRWDGTDDTGRNVATGTYFYELRVGSHCFAGKMNLLR
jgi:hypothetical protein